MSSELKITKEGLKDIAVTVDSYRIRVLIDAKQEILNSGVYNEEQYNKILFKMFDDELIKYKLYNFLSRKKSNDFKALKKFSDENSVEISKTLSLLELLKNESLVAVNEIYDQVEGDENTPTLTTFKDFDIKSIDVDPSKIKSIYEPVKIIFETHNCSGCGLCVGICPVNCLNVYNGFGKIDEDKCISCGLCYYICPRTYLPVRVLNMVQEGALQIKKYSKVGHYLEAYSARTKINEIGKSCQDGGITSTCLHYLFDANIIDIALGAKMSNTPWRPEPIILENKEDILLTTGTKYVNNPTLNSLSELNKRKANLAVVGVPCMMQALLKSAIYNISIPALNQIKYRIGIFCMESFSYESLLKICELLNVDVNDVKKTDINKGKFFVYTKSGDEFTVPIKEIGQLAREDCEVCFDLTSESADISIGSIGSPSGWNTVLIRTEVGKELYNNLIENDLIESKKLSEVKPGLPLLEKIATSKKNKCTKHIDKKKEENLRFPRY
ncbi:MAG TPA: Coenzyme F420 hydrogenase/dehydrogenase, beta subunit C-terminal domain [Candidatus Nanopelagicaceae bacterium]|nr:Coenzyme F420 hydrogenase/dehydrogenase, beta subunit C-terminal domain [Candidatus Nanopelagicaceae bacterium]